MIFVTVGTHYHGFERLVKKMDEIAAKIDEEVIMQIGYADYEPKNARWFKFLNYDEITTFYRKANLIVSHAGAGTLLDILNLDKPCIIVPRLKKYGEISDDRQIELAKALEGRKRGIIVYNVSDIGTEMFKVSILENKEIEGKSLINFLKNYSFDRL